MDSRFSGSETTKPRGRRIAILLIVLLAVGAGVWIGRASAPEENSPPSQSDSGPTAGAREVVNGVPVGYERTEEGAVEAATNFARVMASISPDAVSYQRAIQTLAAPDWRDDAEELANSGLSFFSERYGPGGSLTFVPVRYRVSAYSESAATVELWGVSVASGPKINGVEESWVTGIIDLTWINGDWRVSGQQSEAGPTPELLRTEDERVPEGLRGFEEYQHAPAP